MKNIIFGFEYCTFVQNSMSIEQLRTNKLSFHIMLSAFKPGEIMTS